MTQINHKLQILTAERKLENRNRHYLLTWHEGETPQCTNKLIATSVNLKSIGFDNDEEELLLLDFSPRSTQFEKEEAFQRLCNEIRQNKEVFHLQYTEGVLIGGTQEKHMYIHQLCAANDVTISQLSARDIDVFSSFKETPYLIENFIWGLNAR